MDVNRNTLYDWFNIKIFNLLYFRAFELEMGRLESPDCYFRSISVDLQKKRDYIAKVLNDAGMDPVVPEGGYFIMANWSKLGRYIV